MQPERERECCFWHLCFCPFLRGRAPRLAAHVQPPLSKPVMPVCATIIPHSRPWGRPRAHCKGHDHSHNSASGPGDLAGARGKDCGRQFVEDPQSNRISDEKRALVDKLLAERVSQAGIARVGVSERWVNGYVSARLRRVPPVAQVRIDGREKGALAVECDEVRTYVGQQAQRHVGLSGPRPPLAADYWLRHW
jgi:hypothetical protein